VGAIGDQSWRLGSGVTGSIVDYLAKAAEEQPDRMLYTFLDGRGRVIDSYSYRRFHECSNHVALCLQDTGRIRSGDPVLLIYPPGLDFIVAFFACVKLGALPIPVPTPEASGIVGAIERLACIVRDSGALVALTSSRYHRHLIEIAECNAETKAQLAEHPLCNLNWLCTDSMHGTQRDFRRAGNSLLFLQYTSGSTQEPRGVIVSHSNVIHNCWATLSCHRELPDRPIGVSWLPHYHDLGLIAYYLFAVIAEGSLIGFSSASFLKRPALWLETITKFGGMITSAPNFAFEYCLREDKVPAEQLASFDLGSLRVLMNASEPVRASTHEAFLRKFGSCGLSAKSLVVSYGLAENTVGVSSAGRVRLTVNAQLLERGHLRVEPPRADCYNQLTLMSCGTPLPGVDVQVVNSDTRFALGEDAIGEVWVDGHSKAQGYFNKPSLTEAMFSARLENDNTGRDYLRTGDIGFWHDGELFICGRLKDMIIIGGRNYYPNDIEAVVERSCPEIRRGCVAAFAIEGDQGAEAIAVIAETTKSNSHPDLEQICREIRKRCQIDVDLFAIVPRGTVTKTSSGKIARLECKKRWQSGEITVLASRRRPPRTSGDALIDDLLDRFGIAGYENRTLAELGIDSITLVELSVYIEGLLPRRAKYDKQRSIETLYDLRLLQTVTIGDLQSTLRKFTSNRRVLNITAPAYVRRLQAIDQEEAQMMRRDSELPADIRPQAAGGPRRGKLLLTGATGFFGSFVLETLLRLTDREVVTVSRAENGEHAKARTRAALRRAGVLTERVDDAFELRVRPLNGDIAKPRLGLSSREWTALAAEVSDVYHCAADVDYVKPYRNLRDSNVNGTLELIRIASSGQPKNFHLASTTFIFGLSARERCLEDECNVEMADLNFGYSQSKWVAEQLALAAGQRGLSVKVYRPSFITASQHGQYVERDLIARVFAYMIRHGISVDSINQLSLLPVDHCANNLVALSLLPDPGSRTYHLTADNYYTLQDACSLISRELGYRFDYVSLERGVEHMNAHCGKSDPLYPLRAFFNKHHRAIDGMRDKLYDSRNYRDARSLSPEILPEPALGHTVGAIVSFLQRKNMIPPAGVQEAPRRIVARGA
jgi:thioester reductase-like protein